jgi:hypothetical protein
MLLLPSLISQGKEDQLELSFVSRWHRLPVLLFVSFERFVSISIRIEVLLASLGSF